MKYYNVKKLFDEDLKVKRVFDVDLKDNIRCLNPVMKYCQGCKYGIINYSDDVENYHDTFGANFETNCIYGLEKQKPSKEEMAKFDDWCKNIKRV